MEYGSKFIDDIFRHFLLSLQGIRRFSLSVDNRDFIGITTETGTFVVQRVEYNEIEVLPFQLVLSMLHFIVGFQSKANQTLMRFLFLAQCCCDILSRFQT